MILPVTESFVFSPKDAGLQKAVTIAIARLMRDISLDEIGYIGTVAGSTKRGDFFIQSLFDYDKVMDTIPAEFGGNPVVVPNAYIQRLYGYFYLGDISNNIIDVEPNKNYILFRWNIEMVMAVITDTDMLDRNFKVSVKPLKHLAKDYDDKKSVTDLIPVQFTVDRTHVDLYRKNHPDTADERHFDPEHSESYFIRLAEILKYRKTAKDELSKIRDDDDDEDNNDDDEKPKRNENKKKSKYDVGFKF